MTFPLLSRIQTPVSWADLVPNPNVVALLDERNQGGGDACFEDRRRIGG